MTKSESNKKYYDKLKNNTIKWEAYLEKKRQRYKKNGRKKYVCVCSVCGDSFKSRRKITKFCSSTCQQGGKNNGNWKGGKIVNSSGYVEIYSPYHPSKNKNNKVMEQRLVIEKHIMRFLSDKEVVHHIDGNKLNNNIDNLVLFDDTSKHSSFHQLERRVEK